MNGKVPKLETNGREVPEPSQKVQVMANAEIAERKTRRFAYLGKLNITAKL